MCTAHARSRTARHAENDEVRQDNLVALDAERNKRAHPARALNVEDHLPVFGLAAGAPNDAFLLDRNLLDALAAHGALHSRYGSPVLIEVRGAVEAQAPCKVDNEENLRHDIHWVISL